MIYFLLTLALYLFIPILSSLLLFAPFLVSICYRMPLKNALGWAFGAGFVIDLATYALPLGTHAFIYCCTTLILYDKKQHFFLDNLSTFPIMTFFFSVLITFFLFIFSPYHLSLPLIMSDFFLMPLLDALFAFICYTLPYRYIGPKKRTGHQYFQ